MNNNRSVRNLLISTPLVILPIILSLGALSSTYSVLLSGSQLAFAQEEDVTTNSAGEKIVEQAYAISSPDPLPGHEAHQSVTVLRLSENNDVFSGRITFTATKEVEVQILHRKMNTAGPPNIPEEYGRFPVIDLPGGNGQVSITNIVPKFTEGAAGDTFAASVPFSGNAVALHNLNGEKFSTAYTVTADNLGPAERVDNLPESLTTVPGGSGQEESGQEESGQEESEQQP